VSDRRNNGALVDQGEQTMQQSPQQIAGVYHRRIGEFLVTALSDGRLERTHEMMLNISAEEGQRHLDAAYRPGFVLSVNAFLIRSVSEPATPPVLIETGSGAYLGPAAGHLLANLAIAGVAGDSVETILLTHMHPDHSAGLTDMTTGHANFPNAELVVHENEPRHWFDDAAMARGTEREKKLMFQQAREQTAPYRRRTRTFSGPDREVLPGITAIACHGHTPGHTAYLLESAGQRLLIWGDVVHMPEVQVPRPEVSMVVDVDPLAAAASRRRIFDIAASERLLVTGMHMHFPGFGHIARDAAASGNTYRFLPEPWQQVL
jgi:glyoxylase-like metal-dependent hydrolase (beta-lactamase superfamily II)